MKLKKYLSSLLALAMFASCSNDGILDNTNDGDTPEGAVAFSVNFPGRTFQPTTYGDAQPITQGTLEALDKEKSLEGGVFICVFENTDTNKPGKLVSVEKVDLATSATTALETTGVGGKFFIRGMFDEFAQLVAVANLNNAETELKALIGKPFSDVANLLVKQEPGAAKNFTMVSNPVKVKIPRVETPTTTSISFLLERLAVRIDFKNELKPVVGTHGYGNFDVRTTIGALNQSYLINTLETPLADSDQKGTKYVYRNYWKRLVFDNSKEAKAQLYTYENGKDEFSLSVRVYTSGGFIAFDIPFNKPLVRNTRYLVTLKNGVGGAITHSIQVLPWKDGGDMVISANELRDKPVVTKLSVADNSGEVSNSPVQHALTGDLANLSKITLNTREAYDLRLVVKSNVVPKIEAKGLLTPWMQITEKSASSETVANSEVKVYHLHFAQNDDSYKREARIVLYTDGNYDNPEKNRIIEIEQKETGYNDILNPLALFSNAVVDTPNKFAKPATFENIGSPEVRGKQYQWGRNIPFDPYGAMDIQRKKVLSTNAVDVKANSYYYIPGVYNWHTDEFGNKKWADVVKQLPSPENDDYIGNNDGDPSPEGWKLPSLAQSRAIFLDGFYYYWTSSGVDKIISPLKVDIKKDGEASYKATFKKDNIKGILYTLLLEGISSENTDDKYLTAFRYEWNKEVGLIIKARHIGIVAPISSKPTITQIANEDWWNDKAEKGYGSEVVRIYPKTKLLNGDYDEIICFYCNDFVGGLGANQDWVRIAGPYNDINAYNLISIIDKDKQP